MNLFLSISILAAWVIGLAAHAAPTAPPAGPERVEFVSDGETLVGLLYRPAGLPPDANPPAVVVAPPWLNVKEQVATRWAQAMADRGVAALAFDYRYWGESGGKPREYESASAKVADIQAAVAFLRGRPDLDGARIGGLGICFGAGHMLLAAGRDGDIRSVATVAAWLHDKPSLAAVFGQAEVDRRYEAAREARAAFKADGRVEYVPAASRTDKTAGMYFPGEGFFYADPARGEIPQWTNRMAVMSWDEWLDLDGVAAAAEVGQPLLIVHSDGSALPDNARKALAAAKGPKDLFWTEGEHTQFYDSPAPVAKAAEAVAAHFRRTLGGGSSVRGSDTAAVVATVNSVGAFADQRRWRDLRAAFADEVDVDYSSLTGVPAARVKADDLIAGWEKGLSTFATTEHLIGGHEVTVTGDTAECRARFIATHTRGTPDTADRWTGGGRYRYTLTRVGGLWKVTGTVMTLEWEQGTR